MEVSIITPTYNRGNIISNTIESVCNQSYNKIEYIDDDGGLNDRKNTGVC